MPSPGAKYPESECTEKGLLMADAKIAVLIIDGLGFETEIEHAILTHVLANLPAPGGRRHCRRLGPGRRRPETRRLGQAARLDGLGLAHWSPPFWHNTEGALWANEQCIPAINAAACRDPAEDRRSHLGQRGVVSDQRYGDPPRIRALGRLDHNTMVPCATNSRRSPTRAAGIFAGFEDLAPEIMGNSDTGHQQICNLTVAKQVPTWITEMIQDGSFFQDAKLNAALQRASQGHLVVIKTMLSGEFGDDGYVHSAMRHLWALLDPLFQNDLACPRKTSSWRSPWTVRDSPGRSSTDAPDAGRHFALRFPRQAAQPLGAVRRRRLCLVDLRDASAWTAIIKAA